MARHKLFSVSIADCEVQTFTVSGHGGAGKDTSNTGVRIIHRASGAIGEGCEQRSQWRNKQSAFRKMAKSRVFQAWAKRLSAELITGKSIEDQVEEDMAQKNIRTEVKDEKGRWRIATETDIV